MRIHWRLPHGGDPPSPLGDCALPDPARQIPFCREAEALGFASHHNDFGLDKADPLLLAAVLGMATARMRFIIACRSGLTAPTLFVQQLNTLSMLIGGRFALNVVAGSTPEEQRRYGDWAEHDERWERTDEFLAVARNLWRGGEHDFQGRWYRVARAAVQTPFRAEDGRQAPEIYVGGSSPAALAVARKHADCSLMPADVPARIAAQAAPILAAGKEAGIRASVIARRTRAEAVEAAERLRASAPADAQRVNVDRSDSEMIRGAYARAADEWPLPWLWRGAVRAYGAMSVAIVGSYDEVADALLAYRAAGITQCILAGTPKLDEMRLFGAEVMGRVRAGVSA